MMLMCKLDKPAGPLSFLLETLETGGSVPSWASFEILSPVGLKKWLQDWRQCGDKVETVLEAKLNFSGDNVKTDFKANIYLSSFSCLQCLHKKHKSLAEEAKSINKG